MRIAVTGSGGFLGGHVVHAARARGWEVVPIRLAGHLTTPDAAALGPLLAPAVSCDVLVNCAAALKPVSAFDHFINAEAPAHMATMMSAAGGWLLHVGSANVSLPCLTDSYSRAKRAADTALAALAGVRRIDPGLIWSWSGEGPAAMVARYLDMPLPVHPVPWPCNLYRPILAPDLAALLCDMVEEGPGGASKVLVVGDRRITLFDLVRAMARRRGRRLLPVPTQWLASLVGARALSGSPLLQQFLALDRGLDDAVGERRVLPFSLPA